MRRYQRTSTLVTSNRPVDDWGKLLGDTAAVSAMLDRLLHHGHILKCGPRSYRLKSGSVNAHSQTSHRQELASDHSLELHTCRIKPRQVQQRWKTEMSQKNGNRGML